MIKSKLIIWIFFTVTGLISSFAQEHGTLTDSRDGQVYKWIKIGDQIWMAENLAYLPNINRESDVAFEGNIYYVYGYDGTDIAAAKSENNYEKYGVLYNWDAARESCPAGWHLPSDREWINLEEFLA